MSRVTRLSSEASSHIRSGFVLPSFGQCVEELIANSLDAGAKQITCEFSTKLLNCKVTDDGGGFSEKSLAKVGTRYSTSKCSTLTDVQGNLRYYGYRGEALASIAELSEEIEITSSQPGSNIQLKRRLKPREDQKVSKTVSNGNFKPSTSVEFKGLFVNLPVRRRGVNHVLEAESVVDRVKRNSIVHPYVSFSVLNLDSCYLEFKAPKHEDRLQRFRFNFGDVESTRHVQTISLVSDNGNLILEGGISTHGHENKSLQHVFVNRRPVLRTRIHEEINLLLKRSDISRRLNLIKESLSDDSESYSKVLTTRTYGVYYLNIVCPYGDYDISFEPEKTLVEFRDWKKVILGVRTAVGEFLKKNNLYLSLSTAETAQEAINTGKLPLQPNTDELSHEGCVLGKLAYGDVSPDSRSQASAIEVNKSRTTETENTQTRHTCCMKDTNWICVFDEKSGRNVFVNTLTGMSSTTNPAEDMAVIGCFPTGLKSNRIRPHYVSAFASRSRKDGDTEWNSRKKAQSLVNLKWKNPAVPLKANELQKTDRHRFSSLFYSTAATVQFDKKIFSELEVVGQLDGKFIVCALSKGLKNIGRAASQRMLVLLDQHAVHERIRLEKLERELKEEVKTTGRKLSERLLLYLDKAEVKILAELEEKLSKVGLRYELNFASGIIEIITIPQTFFQTTTKIRREDQVASIKLMIQRLIKDEIQVYRDTGRGSTSLPQSIFDSLCSQACHGAIRFGDQLSVDQCRNLVSELSRCQLPFQCAHGRPSIAPLTYDAPPYERKKPNLAKLRS